MTSFTWAGFPTKLGDICVWSSFFENYYLATGDKLLDTECKWVTDHNPFVIRNNRLSPTKTIKLRKESPTNGRTLAETACIAHEIPCSVFWPKFYIYENLLKIPKSICINTTGVSNGGMDQTIINHIREKYKNCYIFQVGGLQDLDFASAFDYRKYSLWEQIKILAECQTFIGLDSAWYHIASAYNIKRKVILVNKTEQECEYFLPIPQEIKSGGFQGWIHDNCDVFNPYFRDLGLTRSYLEL